VTVRGIINRRHKKVSTGEHSIYKRNAKLHQKTEEGQRCTREQRKRITTTAQKRTVGVEDTAGDLVELDLALLLGYFL